MKGISGNAKIKTIKYPGIPLISVLSIRRTNLLTISQNGHVMNEFGCRKQIYEREGSLKNMSVKMFRLLSIF